MSEGYLEIKFLIFTRYSLAPYLPQILAKKGEIIKVPKKLAEKMITLKRAQKVSDKVHAGDTADVMAEKIRAKERKKNKDKVMKSGDDR